ncbi:MAG: hypothetical protein K0Q50_1642 [Vampirovibrio sp.]|jgi:hypothetical protein|nr:hypothetical protein [Vampirovibrio sp.]
MALRESEFQGYDYSPLRESGYVSMPELSMVWHGRANLESADLNPKLNWSSRNIQMNLTEKYVPGLLSHLVH